MIRYYIYKIIIKLFRITKLLPLLPDRLFLKMYYPVMMNEDLDLENPKTFNQKLQWLKLYDRKPEYTMMVDKYSVKKYISQCVGEEYIIPTLGVWDSFDDIDFDSLPSQFVLKCTHDSGGVVICNNKNKLDLKQVKNKIESSMKRNYFYNGREWPYKNVPHRIIAEQYMSDGVRNFTLLGFDKNPRIKLVYRVNFNKNFIKEIFYDEVWISEYKMKMNQDPILKRKRKKQYTLMKEISNRLSVNDFISYIEFYEINSRKYYFEILINDVTKATMIASQISNLKCGDLNKFSGGYKYEMEGIEFYFSYKQSENEQSKALIDYKFFCFNGVVDSVMVCTERETGHPKFYFFDKDWKLKKYTKLCKEVPSNFAIEKPKCMDEMFSLAEKLSQNIPHVRVDLYSIDDIIYFGEMTFYSDSGFDSSLLPEADRYLGDKLILPVKI